MATVAIQPLDATRAGTPDQPEMRISTLDFIRGVAVLGILATNILNYGQLPGAHRWLKLIGEPSFADKVLWAFNYLFIDGKLRGLFAMLFGAGLVLFMERARKKGANPWWLQGRRLFWLALFGLFHFYVLFHGDILFHYAALGLVAMFLVRLLPPKVLLTAGLLLYAADSWFASVDLWAGVEREQAALAQPEGSPARNRYDLRTAEQAADATQTGAVLATGSLPQIVTMRVRDMGLEPFLELPLMVTDSLACILFGAGLFRMGFFSGGWDRRRLLLWGTAGILTSLILAVPLVAMIWAADFPPLLNLFVFYGPVHVQRLPMILGYAAIMVAMTPAWGATGLGKRLSAAGRMAFTNYLGASAVMAVIFQGWGLGLYGQYMRPGLWVFTLFGWALMLLFSPWWLARFRYGPLEWLWRCLTYWRVFSNRRTAPA